MFNVSRYNFHTLRPHKTIFCLKYKHNIYTYISHKFVMTLIHLKKNVMTCELLNKK